MQKTLYRVETKGYFGANWRWLPEDQNLDLRNARLIHKWNLGFPSVKSRIVKTVMIEKVVK